HPYEDTQVTDCDQIVKRSGTAVPCGDSGHIGQRECDLVFVMDPTINLCGDIKIVLVSKTALGSK
ncbi:hypothetical protein SARC_18240, partial [Sphaeroforma arctica JP610]